MLPNTLEELNDIRDECRKMVSKRSALSAGASVIPIPIPGLDVGTDVGILMEMIPNISEKFGLSHEQVESMPASKKKMAFIAITNLSSGLVGKAITGPLILNTLKKMGVKIVSRTFLRFIPFVGQATAAAISFSSMRLLGNTHVNNCYSVALSLMESGGVNQDIEGEAVSVDGAAT